MSNDPPLVLVTSTRWPYLRDILDIMFLPSGMSYRFRYSPEYVSQAILENPLKLRNRKGYVIHANTTKRPEKFDEVHELLPIREITIRHVKQYGEFIWIHFELGNWVLYSDGEARPNEHHLSVRNATPEESRDLLRLTLYEAPGLTMRTLADDCSGVSEEVIRNWMRIVKGMKEFQGHREYRPDYLKLACIRDAKCENSVTPTLISEFESGYAFRSGNDYRVEIVQFNLFGPPDEPYPLRLSVDHKRVVPLVTEATILGRYDSLTTSFRPTATLSSYRTTLRIEACSGSKMRLNVALHAKILTSWKRLASAAWVAIGIGVSAIVPSLSPGSTVNYALIGGLLAVAGFISLIWSGERD
jgi:hypothetical protein